jgi:hypothetical protein
LDTLPQRLGRFELIRRIGVGSTGAVYAARDPADGARAVAVKHLVRLDGDGVYRFKSEFRALTFVVHPHLVRLYELIEDHREWLVTMELVEGDDFLDYVRPAGVLDVARLEHALVGIVSGLGALHAHGKLHRDLKPSNVRVTPAGRVVILDLGLALVLEAARLGAPGDGRGGAPELAGTPAYMSPEQARSQPLDAASDAYALGVMLYEALYGRLPFEGSGIEQLLGRLGEPPPLPPLPGVPEHLRALCRGLLVRERAQRLSLAEVRARLGQSSSAPPRAEVPFVGRAAELAALHAARAEATERAVVVDVVGASGSGKSTLIERFVHEATADGARVVVARCYERAHVPYKALEEVVDALAEHVVRLGVPADVWALARLFPSLGRVPEIAAAPAPPLDDGPEIRARAFAVLRALLGRLAEERPLIVVIDDLQWGDVDGAILLASLVRPPRAPRLLLVVGYREEDAARSACLGAWAEARVLAEARRVRVGPLLHEEACRLARALLPPDDARVDVVARDSAGSPFLLAELARARPGGPAPSSIDEAVRARARALPVEAQRLLEVLALARGPLEQGMAAAVAGVQDGSEAIAQLRFEQLARTHGYGEHAVVETYHDRVREAVEAAVDEAPRRLVHRRLAEQLEGVAGTPAERLAEHYAAAGLSGRAADHASRAAEHALRALAFDRAAESYAWAASLLPPDDARRAELEVQRAGALASAGRGAESARAYLRGARGVDVALGLELRRRAAEQLLASGHIDEGLEVVQPVLAHVGLALAPTPRRALLSWLGGRARLRLRLGGLSPSARRASDARAALGIDVCWTLTLGLNAVDMVRSADFATRGLIAALDAGDRARAGRALGYEAAISAFLGDRARALVVLGQLEALAGEDDYLRAQVQLVSGVIEAFTLGRWATALEHYRRAQALFDEKVPGAVRERATLALLTSWSLYYRGELGELARRTAAQEAAARARGDVYGEAILSNAAAWVRLAADDAAGAEDEVRARRAAWTARGFHLQHYQWLLASTHVDRYLGAGRRALARWHESWTPLVGSQLLRTRSNALVAHYERGTSAVQALGQGQAEAREIALGDARFIERAAVGWALPFVGLIRGGVAQIDGDAARARRELEAAARGFEAADMGLYAASVRLVLARAAASTGEPAAVAVQAAAAQAVAAYGVRAPARWAAMVSGL